MDDKDIVAQSQEKCIRYKKILSLKSQGKKQQQYYIYTSCSTYAKMLKTSV